MKVYLPAVFLVSCLLMLTVDCRPLSAQKTDPQGVREAYKDPATGEVVYFYKSLEQKPTFNGGNVETFRYWIEEQIPENYFERPSTPTDISFVVDGKGRLRDVKVVKSQYRTDGKRIAAFVRTSPRWEPGSVGGRKVNTFVTCRLYY